MGRAPCCQKVGLKKGRWTAEEDQILSNYIQANGEGSWRSLPKNAGLLRCGKSCRLRWINYLRTDIKRGNISVEEENTIVKLHASFGNRWSLIASHLPGRTDNEIKNYWNSHLSRKIYRGNTNEEIIILPPKPKRGRTSRWAMKKNNTYSEKSEKLHVSRSNDVHSTAQQENIGPTMVQCVECEKEINDNMLGPFKEVSNEEEVLSFDDIIIDNCWEEASLDLSFTSFGELEKESNNDVVGTERGDTCTNDSMMVSLNEDLQYSSSSSIVSVLEDDNWDWESLVQFDHMDQPVLWGNQENILNWLCEDEDEDEEKINDIEKQNAMVDWFVS